MFKYFVVALVCIFPISASADLKKIDDLFMNSITAQEGVRITVGGSSATQSLLTDTFTLLTDSSGAFLNASGQLIDIDGNVVTTGVIATLSSTPAPDDAIAIDSLGYYINGDGKYFNGTSWVLDHSGCFNKYTNAPTANALRSPLMFGALEIRQKSVSTAWTNKNNSGTVETGIVNKVTQTRPDVIYIKGDVTIQAKSDGSVSSIEIGLPEVAVEKGSKKTEMYITSRDSDLSDSNFISQVTTGAGVTGKLGTQYTNAGFTYIKPGGMVTITSLP